MTALWLASVALAGSDQAELTARLLGPAPAPVQAAAATDPTGGVRMALLVFGVLAVGIGLFWIRRLLTQQGAGAGPAVPLRVVSRVSLGGTAALAVVEVHDAGETTRYLVGYGGGAPVLLSALSSDGPALVPVAYAEPEPVEPEAETVPVEAPRARRDFVPVETRDEPDDGRVAPLNPLAARFASNRATTESPADLAARKAAARQMIDDALASRRRMTA